MKFKKTVCGVFVSCLLAALQPVYAASGSTHSAQNEDTPSLNKSLEEFFDLYDGPAEFKSHHPWYAEFFGSQQDNTSADNQSPEVTKLAKGERLLHTCTSSSCDTQMLVVLDKDNAVSVAAFIKAYKEDGSDAGRQLQAVYIFQKPDYNNYIDFTDEENKSILDWLQAKQKSDAEFKIGQLYFMNTGA